MRRFVLCLTLVTLACQPGATVGGDGTITGKLDGRPCDTDDAAYVIGHPQDPAQTAVIYVFDAPVGCDELSRPGWDERVADSVQSLELKLIGGAALSPPATTPLPAWSMRVDGDDVLVDTGHEVDVYVRV